MTSRLNPYIGFKDNARDAMTFYQEVFGGELTISTFGEFGAADQAGADAVMHSQLDTASGFTLMGSDTPPGMPYDESAGRISISLSGDDGDAVRGYWEKLSAKGSVTLPLEKQMWGDEFGMCTDQFGVPWLVNISAPQA